MSAHVARQTEPLMVRQLAGQRLAIHRHGPAAGSARPLNLFLLHGMADTADTWLTLHPLLPQATLWSFDMPWSGRQGNQWPHHMTATEWWRAAMALCPVAPDVCVGHSFGATVLLDWLQGGDAPPLRGLVLLAPYYHAGQRPLDWCDLDDFAGRVPERLADALRAHLSAGRLPEPRLMAAMVRMLSRRIVPDALLEFFRLVLKSRGWPLAALACPTLVVAGECDEALVRDSAAQLAAVLPLAELSTLADCGHHPLHQQTAALASRLTRFIDSLGRIDGVACPRLEPRPEAALAAGA